MVSVAIGPTALRSSLTTGCGARIADAVVDDEQATVTGPLAISRGAVEQAATTLAPTEKLYELVAADTGIAIAWPIRRPIAYRPSPVRDHMRVHALALCNSDDKLGPYGACKTLPKSYRSCKANDQRELNGCLLRRLLLSVQNVTVTTMVSI